MCELAEIWENVAGYDGKYRVSTFGRVASLATGEYCLRKPANMSGYLYVTLFRNGKGKRCAVHRLVAEAFLPNPNNLPVVNHKDRNPQNCRLDNLEWTTNSDNIRHAYQTESKVTTPARLAYEALMSCYPRDITDLDGEEWRDIAGYEGLYQESNYGRTRSFHNGKIRILKPLHSVHGYLKVNLHKDGLQMAHYVHKLVAETFIPNPLNLPEVNHIFGNKFDCSADNLEWCTPSQNIQHAFKTGIHKIVKGEKCPHAKISDADREYIRKVYIPYDKEFGMSALARKFGVAHPSIWKIIHGRRKR